MIFGELDLPTLERNAWQRGDYQQAEVIALAIDWQHDQEEADRCVEEAEADYARCKEAWGKHNDAMRKALDDLYQMVELAARVSNRPEILKAIADVGALIDKADGD